MSQLNQTKPNKSEQTKFAKPDEQSMVHLENMSQKTNNREFTQRPITMARLGHNGNLQTILYSQQNYKQRRVETLSLILQLTKTWVRSRKSHLAPFVTVTAVVSFFS